MESNTELSNVEKSADKDKKKNLQLVLSKKANQELKVFKTQNTLYLTVMEALQWNLL